MNQRRAETELARATLGGLLIYVPIETWVSIPYGVLSKLLQVAL